VRAWKILAQQPQLAQAVGLHEMGVVDDRHEQLAGAVHAEGLLHEQPLAAMVVALELDLERLAEDAQGVVVSVERAVDDRCDHPLRIVGEQRLLEDTLAGAGLAEHQAQAALLGVDLQDVEDILLVRQERERLAVEGIFLEAEVGADHAAPPGAGAAAGARSLAMGSSGFASPMRSAL
jgi:hypothetical protein